MAALDRFKAAQDAPHGGFEDALAEIRNGHKRGHWIWYVFPQLAGLGSSGASQQFGIQGRAEAAAYLRNDTLRARLLTVAEAAAKQLDGHRARVDALMGSRIDALKLVSSMTLFGRVAHDLHAAGEGDDYRAIANAADRVLTAAAHQGYRPCAFTLDQLR